MEDIMADVLSLEGIYKRLSGREILKNVSFTVKQGDIFGFLGPNGAGKTTTIRIALGILQPTAGTVSILGQNVSLTEARKNIGFVLEMDGLYDNLTADTNLHYYAEIYGIDNPRETVANALKLVHLSDRASDKVGAYSKGMRQRLALARAFLHDPQVLILDEPTSGVDPSGQIEMRELILDKAHNGGKTFFLSSHNLDEVQRICNRIALINHGEIKLCGDREALQHKAGKGKIIIETLQVVPETTVGQIRNISGIDIESQIDKKLVLNLRNGNDTSTIVSFLVDQGVKIEEVKHVESSLEDIYTNILKEVER
jgi:ABC-2 type transport system ATP-binding protein